MRYLILSEYDPEDLDKAIETRNATSVVRETTPRKLPKILLEAHQLLVGLPKLTGTFCGVTALETDDPEQLEDLMTFMMSKFPEMKTMRVHVLPITAVDSFLQKIKEQRSTR